MQRVLVIIPAYNESATIADVLASLRDHVPEYDVVVVDDGSIDDTAAIVERTEGAALLRLAYNVGIGGAMQTGYLYAVREGYDVAVQCDADGQHPVEQLRSLVDRLDQGDADMVIGSRYVADTAYTPSVFRRVGKSLMSRLVDVVMGAGITDTTSGFRAANRKAFCLFARHYPDDYPEAETLVIMHKSGLRPVEIPVEMSPRQGGRTSISPRHALYYMIKVGLAIFIDVFRKFTKAEGD
ncbi:MAG: glycosyltransferase family 2 protein [bacterium]|nr:glycosyltransferase family 2 protein [bacterium]